jgi:hypothetical protein
MKNMDMRRNGDGGRIGLGVAAAAIMVVCCLGPALLIGGGLAATAGVLAVPTVGLLGIATAAVGGAWFLRRRHRPGDGACCTPQHQGGTSQGAASQGGEKMPSERMAP